MLSGGDRLGLARRQIDRVLIAERRLQQRSHLVAHDPLLGEMLRQVADVPAGQDEQGNAFHQVADRRRGEAQAGGERVRRGIGAAHELLGLEVGDAGFAAAVEQRMAAPAIEHLTLLEHVLIGEVGRMPAAGPEAEIEAAVEHRALEVGRRGDMHGDLHLGCRGVEPHHRLMQAGLRVGDQVSTMPMASLPTSRLRTAPASERNSSSEANSRWLA